ncbi:transmembrane and coiled-coil domain-containing protein 5B-like isoform X1 [Macrotis lagotis]|uniref:transmembrane and coiled-coil domain-containing protein 5B-like isoform X1 n=1 Tax=Macrotis lagotis TaxID=92651 RepID=UPI003D68DBDD
MTCCPTLPWMISFLFRKPVTEEISQGSLDSSQEKVILRLVKAKKNLGHLILDFEKDMLQLDEENQDLLKEIKEKELQIQSLGKKITNSIGLARERDEFNYTAYEREEVLKNLKLETTKLKKKNVILAKNVNELQMKLSNKPPENLKEVENENLQQLLEESKVKLQKTIVFCAEQEKELAKVTSECRSLDKHCKDTVNFIKDCPVCLLDGPVSHQDAGLWVFAFSFL